MTTPRWNWNIFPWQTPEGEGFRAPWSAPAQPEFWQTTPTATYGAEMNPELYLTLLDQELVREVEEAYLKGNKQGKDAEKKAQLDMQRAEEMVTRGLWNTDLRMMLPRYSTIRSQYSSYLATLPPSQEQIQASYDEELRKVSAQQGALSQAQQEWQKGEEAKRFWYPKMAKAESQRRMQAKKAQTLSRAELARLWEQRELPTNWIERYLAQQEENPFLPPERKEPGAVKNLRLALEQGPKYIGDVSAYASYGGPLTIQQHMEAVQRRQEEYEDYVARMQESAEKQGYTIEGGEITKPKEREPSSYVKRRQREQQLQAKWEAKHPPALEWMKKWLPEATETRKGYMGVIKSAIGAPSGQMWSSLLPSQQQQWGEYASWAGLKPEDLLYQMGQMLPKRTPRVGTWRPARQRA